MFKANMAPAAKAVFMTHFPMKQNYFQHAKMMDIITN